jgi:hypothetical protein
MEKLDVHYYDGKMMRINIKEAKSDEKKGQFDKLYELVRQHPNLDEKIRGFSLQAIKIIIEDINKNPNYSGSDLQRADDILFHICMKIFAEKDQNTIITNLAEQLSDIVTSGSCPQGRVNRLMQLYLAFQLQG